MTTGIDIGILIMRIPEVRNGRPCIVGTGITVRRIVGWYKLGFSPEEIADEKPADGAQGKGSIGGLWS